MVVVRSGIDDAAVRAQVLVRDPGFHPLFGDVQDGHRRRLGPGSGRRGHGEQGLQGRRRVLAAAYGRVDVVHDLAAVRGYEIADLRRVYARPAPDRDETVETAFPGEVRRRLQRVGRRLDARAVPDLDLHAGTLDHLPHAVRYAGLDHPRVRDEHDPPHAQPLDLPTNLIGGAQTVLQRGRLHGEDRLVAVSLHATPPLPRGRPGFPVPLLRPIYVRPNPAASNVEIGPFTLGRMVYANNIYLPFPSIICATAMPERGERR